MPERLARLEREVGGPLVPGGEEVRSPPARRPALAQRLVRRGLADRGDGVHRDRAGPRLPGAHRPLSAAEGGQRALGGAADPPARRRRGRQRAPGPGGRPRLPAAQGHRGRHPRRRRARPDRGDAGPARRTRRVGALQAGHGQGADDPSGWSPPYATRSPTCSATAPVDWSPATGECASSRSSTPRRCSAPAWSPARRSRSTPGPSVGTHRPGCCSRRSTSAACSRSTATRTRPGSSTSRSTGVRAPRSSGSTPTASSTPGRVERLLEWARP